MTAKIRIGICGTGSFGTARARALAQLENCSVAMGWSRSPSTRERFSSELDVPTVDSGSELCTSSEIDAVFVCSPNIEHFAYARTALQAGKHVLVETPLGVSYEQAKELAQLAATQDRVLHHGAKHRYHPDHAEHIDRLRRVGHLLFAFDHAAFDFGPNRPWYADAQLTGGARTFLPYVMLNWLEAFGQVDRTVGEESARGDWQVATVILHFAAGGHVVLSYAIGLGIPEAPTRQLVGTEGSILTLPGANPIFIQGDSQSELVQRDVDIVACECRAFLDEIGGQRDHRVDLDLDLRAWELVDQALKPPSQP